MDKLSLFMDHINYYPFNLKYPSCILNIKLKLDNTLLKLTNEEVVSNKPIFIEYNQNDLFIWNTIENGISDEGDIIYQDFEGNKIKTKPAYCFMYWLIPKTIKLNEIIIIGNNNKIEINNIKISDTILNGKDNIIIPII